MIDRFLGNDWSVVVLLVLLVAAMWAIDRWDRRA